MVTPTQSSPQTPPTKKGATVTRTRFSDRVYSYFKHHKDVAGESLNRLRNTPWASFLTVVVMGIALALPSTFFVLLKNANQLAEGWSGHAQISLFLSASATDTQAKDIQQQLQSRADLERVEYMAPEAALAEFKEFSGFADVLESLDSNPLPAVIIVYPSDNAPEQVEALQAELAALDKVDQAQLDSEWVNRLHNILRLLEAIMTALGVLLALAVMLVVINTLKLSIESRREEVVVMKLIGATDSYVRRPFLYTGLWFGLGGSLFAFWLVQVALAWMVVPVEALAASYGSDFTLSSLGSVPTLVLLGGGCVLGLLGAWWAVQQHLRAIEPH